MQKERETRFKKNFSLLPGLMDFLSARLIEETCGAAFLSSSSFFTTFCKERKNFLSFAFTPNFVRELKINNSLFSFRKDFYEWTTFEKLIITSIWTFLTLKCNVLAWWIQRFHLKTIPGTFKSNLKGRVCLKLQPVILDPGSFLKPFWILNWKAAIK